MMTRLYRILLFLIVIVVGLFSVYAYSDAPVVQVALFYSPTCTHCEQVINNVLPPIQKKYGDALQMLFINVAEQSGSILFYDACNALKIPENRCGAVPTMVIGQVYLIGSGEIPARMENLVDAGLANGGLDVSQLPMLWDVLQQRDDVEAANNTQQPQSSTWQDRFMADRVANSIAVIVLLGLIFSLIMMARVGIDIIQRIPSNWLIGRMRFLVFMLVTAGGTLISLSIGLNSEAMPAGVALVVASLFAAGLIVLSTAGTEQSRYSLIPVIAVAGLLISLYLSYVESGQNTAACGVIGDCNTVQNSPYARILGVPIGLIGVLSYLMILTAWVFGRDINSTLANWSKVALLLFSLLGVIFSAYLTFLEPFVIGASCSWCLTSALAMMLLLWLSVSHGSDSLLQLLSGRVGKHSKTIRSG